MKFIKNICLLTCIFVTSTLFSTQIYGETPSIEIYAESAILIDATNKSILFEKNAHTKQYPASITKLMTALLAIENLDRDDTLTFSKEAIFGIERGSSHIGMDVNEEISINDALHGLLLMSANEVANGLAESVSGSIDDFAIKMTSRARELGAENTNFVNPHGLHDDNHYTTAYDMALIASEIVLHDYFLEIMQDYTYIIGETNITNQVRHLSQDHKMFNPYKDGSIFREDVIGGKTGYTDQARHTLVTMAKQGDTTLIAVVLKSEKSTLYSDTAKLLDYGFASYHTISLHHPNEVIKTLPMYGVKSGIPYQEGSCGISVLNESNLTIPNNTYFEDIITNIETPNYIDSSYEIGDSIGQITYINGSKILAKDTLVISDIDISPIVSDFPISNEITVSKIHGLYVIVAVITIFIMVIFIFIICIRKRRRRRKTLKLKKLFK